MRQLKLLFGMKMRITRRPYLCWGLVLMGLKYAGDCLFYFLATNDVFPLVNFLSPLLQHRYPFGLPDWFAPVVVLWSLPFIWLGVGMSIRRAADANFTPWLGILFFVPGVNYLLMAALSLWPSSTQATWIDEQRAEDTRRLLRFVAITFGFALFGAALSWFNTNLVRTYSSSLFIGAPLILGLVQAYLLNAKNRQSLLRSITSVAMTILFIHLLLLIFALEGIICLAMSLPLSTCLGALGAMFGTAIARYGRRPTRSPVLMLIALPIMPVVEKAISEPQQDVVLSTVHIAAAPEQVWPNVIQFSELPQTTDWLFELGIAYPQRARIEGSGIAAVRHCEFSTGDFVEPITVWQPPTRLAFDVRYQPQPMKELSFYDHVDAPHLDGYFRSIRGEFRLVQTSAGQTRLEGRTWYEVDMQPSWYWQLYGRWLIHRIHLRVLEHIKSLSEGDARSSDT